MSDVAPFVRIGLRILGGYMVGKGHISEESLPLFRDPEVIGAVVLVLNEAWYFAARRFGWAK